MTETTFQTDPRILYCALKYQPARGSVLPDDNIFLVALRPTAEAEARIFVHPGWRRMIEPEDRAYIEEIVEEIAERAKIDPDALMRQLSSLGVGLLRTVDASNDSSTDLRIADLTVQFEEYKPCR